ncbi:MAG: hypothetical protein Unbinned8261contig1001_18 [Prokaryotic dsDNA virus sp.]|nr:MAG: hypothetical protein Unbinned8261contig1001_18 [Prokaryotic dsDNA virus sp.]|tara:strand:- start:21061 stop:21234 length:174 start_codon:yes stop_codon:yes gene_type:complete
MPTNRELELDRLKKLDTMSNKIDELMDLLKIVHSNTCCCNKVTTKGKKSAGKTSKSS